MSKRCPTASQIKDYNKRFMIMPTFLKRPIYQEKTIP
jgi:hypothetical protein